MIHVEKAAFIPIVFSTFGGAAPEADRLLKQIAAKISIKKKEKYALILSHIRNKLRFALLKATLISLHGYRGSPTKIEEAETDDEEEFEFNFNLLPEMTAVYDA